jgi:hypothetical protein
MIKYPKILASTEPKPTAAISKGLSWLPKLLGIYRLSTGLSQRAAQLTRNIVSMARQHTEFGRLFKKVSLSLSRGDREFLAESLGEYGLHS